MSNVHTERSGIYSLVLIRTDQNPHHFLHSRGQKVIHLKLLPWHIKSISDLLTLLVTLLSLNKNGPRKTLRRPWCFWKFPLDQ